MKMTGNQFKRSTVLHIYQQLVSECFTESTTQTESEKVPNTVGTFLKTSSKSSHFKREIGYAYQQLVSESVKVSALKAALEKVASTVATFLPDNTNPMHIIRVVRIPN